MLILTDISYKVHEFETQLLDDDDPNEVDLELMGASDYYEKNEQIADIKEDDDIQRERMFEWVFSKIEVLQLEKTQR